MKKNILVTRVTRFIKIALLVLVAPCALAQNANRTVQSVADKGSYLEISVSDGKYLLKPYSDKIIETTFIPKGEIFNPASHAVVLTPVKVKTNVKDTATNIEYATAGMTVHIVKAPFQISYAYKGKSLISEKTGYAKKDGAEILDFNLDATEALYGAGARALGMNRRGNRLPLYNKAPWIVRIRCLSAVRGSPCGFSRPCAAMNSRSAGVMTAKVDCSRRSYCSSERL